ncbi:hypothetical protein Acsp03_38660 [Actinomadura sp. NBRC 104412]|nr:hypothetical protein Acsp03_38660 [Actinomadura sp. NBRC 104412]
MEARFTSNPVAATQPRVAISARRAETMAPPMVPDPPPIPVTVLTHARAAFTGGIPIARGPAL